MSKDYISNYFIPDFHPLPDRTIKEINEIKNLKISYDGRSHYTYYIIIMMMITIIMMGRERKEKRKIKRDKDKVRLTSKRESYFI